MKHLRILPLILLALIIASGSAKDHTKPTGPEDTRPLFTRENRARVITVLEEYLSAEGKETAADSLVDSQLPDGSWSDINYKDRARSDWDATRHMNRIVTLSCAYHTSKDTTYFNAIAKALDYWTTTRPECVNWWYNEINIPKILGPAIILIRTELTAGMLEDATSIMDRAKIYKTGQNKVWLAGNVLMNAVLKQDEKLAKTAHTAMTEEIKVIAADSSEEGIQYDWSFHQHGAQLQIGNYGLAFIRELSNWFKAWKGTCLEVTGEKLEIMKNFVYNGMEWVMWKGYFDHNACGRQVMENTQTKKYDIAAKAIEKMGLELKSPVGAQFYPKSDFAVYRTADWYASVRMQSSETIGYEVTNDENKKGFFSADGATLVRRRGDEYFNVSAVWNWEHIPGVTCPAVKLKVKFVPNNSAWTFGNADGEYMVTAMELDREGLTAHKAWFFCPEGYVCLGAGITYEGNHTVTTGVEQCLINGLQVEKSGTWIRHNGITYVPIDGTFSVAAAAHTGNWADIYPTTGPDETKDLLDIYISHGKNPANASYAYMVVPTDLPGATAAAYIGNQAQMLSNTGNLQKVSLFGKTMTVDWSSHTATIE